ncbi:MBL fold metallo-hydrolase [Rhodobacterales bacterium HKCCE2091]|nr:MBL fold metallo-hydrolase [Rhodobacterales bacterium HKCCE2091]
MPTSEKFSASRAAASLPGLPPPKRSHGPLPARARFGRAELMLVSDGAMTLPFRALAPEAPDGALEALYGGGRAPEFARGELTHALIRAGDELVLVDTGSGPFWQKGAGKLAGHLAQNGIAPGEVTRVVLTHLHPDHAWGTLTRGGDLVFPNAAYYAGAGEIAFWSDRGLPDRVGSGARPAVEGAQKVLAALGDRVSAVTEGDEILPGLTVIDTPGHSPGHVSLLLAGDEGLIVTGDAVVNDRVSFAHPDWRFAFDMDDETARKSRRRLLEMSAANGHALAGYHWGWPGLGHAERSGAAYRFVPR